MFKLIYSILIGISIITTTPGKPPDLPKYTFEERQQPRKFTIDEHTKVWLDGKQIKGTEIPDGAEVLEVDYSPSTLHINVIKLRSIKKDK